MSSSAVLTSVRRLRSLLAAHEGCEQSDEQLLAAFADRRDEIAFAALVRRHGPMVLGVCRRVLGHAQDAEDAYQATFLVLARRAAELRDKTALASFLHGAAYRLASKIKRAAGRRRKYEGQTPARSPIDPANELLWREVRELLDEEIARLSEKYRSVFVLCCLENLSRAEAAQRLGLKERAVLSRLAEARKRLSQCLARRGVELTAVLAAIAVATPPASAVPAGLMASTIGAALAMTTGEKWAGIVSASVAELLKDMTAAMIASKVKMVTVVVLAGGVLTVATSGSLVSWYGRASGPLAATSQPPAAKADDNPKAASPQRETAKSMEIQGRVVDPEGKPKASAKLLLLSHGSNRKVTQLGVSAADGRYSVVVPQLAGDEILPALIAQADGAGIAFFGLYQWKPGKLEKPVELRLVKDRVIRGRIVSTEGKPVVGARVTVENLGACANDSMDSVLASLKKRPYDWYGQRSVTWMAPRMSFRRQGDALFTATTDAEGRFVVRGLGDERFVTLSLRGGGVTEEELLIVNRDGFDAKPYNQAMLDSIPKGMGHPMVRTRLHGPNVFAIAETEKIIRGIVKDADSGKGLPNAVVYLTNTELRLQTRTDVDGRYEMHGARKAKSYTLQVDENPTLGYVPCRVVADDTIGYQPITADIKVKKGVIITGKMIDGATGKPLPGFVRAAVLIGNPFVKDFPAFNFTPEHRIPTHSGANGVFRLVAIPGPVMLMGQANEEFKFKPAVPDPKYPQYFRIDAEPALTGCNNADGSIWPLLRNFCKVLEIKADAKNVKQDIVLERTSVLPVPIQDADGKPLRGVWAAGSTPQKWYPVLCEKAECSVYYLEPGKPRLMVFFHTARKLAGTLTLQGDEKAPVVANLSPAGSIEGRLLDASGKPLAGIEVDLRYRDGQAQAIDRAIHDEKQAVTSAVGGFAFDDVIPQQKFELSFRHGKRRFERETKTAEATIQVKSGEFRDLGAIKVKPVPENAGE